MAALVLSETICEHIENKQPLFLSFLDTQKAFDVVSHDSMKCKLFHQDINLHLWSTIDNLYASLSSRVMWKDNISSKFPVLQGVRQGGILSTGLYKLYINDLLLQLSTSQIGTFIGTTYTGCPTVADDVTLSNNSEVTSQCALDIALTYANRELYTIHPEKSVIIRKYIPPKYIENTISWTLGDKELSQASKTSHLGLIRSTSDDIQLNVEDRISCARRTFYSLTSTGLHGSNGLQPMTSSRIYTLYVLPRLLYGLETFVLQRKHIIALEAFHISMLRIIQSLPQRSARCITYLLLGIKPVEAEIHSRTLTFLGNIIRSENVTLRAIMERQLSVKGHNSSSWFIYVQGLLEKYNLQDIYSLIQNIPTKDQWKITVSKAISAFWTDVLLQDFLTKSTLRFCNIHTLKLGQIHPVWNTVDNNVHDARRAITKVRLLTGTYIVQSKLSKFNQNEVDPRCQLCFSEVEDYLHMLLQCGALLSYRRKYIENLIDIIGHSSWCEMNNQSRLEIILDVSAANVSYSLGLSRDACVAIERISRRLCHSVHSGRVFLLEGVQRRKK